jgi:hypothetical protein
MLELLVARLGADNVVQPVPVADSGTGGDGRSRGSKRPRITARIKPKPLGLGGKATSFRNSPSWYYGDSFNFSILYSTKCSNNR